MLTAGMVETRKYENRKITFGVQTLSENVKNIQVQIVDSILERIPNCEYNKESQIHMDEIEQMWKLEAIWIRDLMTDYHKPLKLFKNRSPRTEKPFLRQSNFFLELSLDSRNTQVLTLTTQSSFRKRRRAEKSLE
uniref:Uncharacterized protein n=1 Tax=Loa loa TaxID=7209 RepID=A0A1I7VJX1_LOALO